MEQTKINKSELNLLLHACLQDINMVLLKGDPEADTMGFEEFISDFKYRDMDSYMLCRFGILVGYCVGVFGYNPNDLAVHIIPMSYDDVVNLITEYYPEV